MEKKILLRTVMAVLFMASAMIIGCGSSGSDDVATSPPSPITDPSDEPTTTPSPGTDPSDAVLGTPSGDTGNTSFAQHVAVEDGDGEVFPGHANVWDIYDDFSLDDGGDDQFDNAMVLTVDGNYFSSQVYGDLTFYTPAAGTSDGVLVAVVTDDSISGTYSGQLNNLHDGRLFQEVDLSTATGAITVNWSWDVNTDEGNFASGADIAQLVVRDPVDDSLLETIYSVQSESTSQSFDLTAFAGQSILISFEINSNSDWDQQFIDDVSITDGAGTEFITNGDFESGTLDGWNTNTPAELQNMTSAEETLSGLTVTRSFYTIPDKLWGRWVDVFKNQTAGEITASVEYESDLGSDDYGIIYLTPGTGDKALTTWDGDNSDRDVGVVFGSADGIDFTSDDVLGDGNGEDSIYHRYAITIAPGQTVAIVNFIIMNGVETGETATDITARATAIDAEAVTIVDNFWTDGQYRTGMTQDQIDSILNF